MAALVLNLARVVAAVLVALLRIGGSVGVGFVARLLSRVAVFEFLEGDGARAFAARLLSELHRKRQRGELDPTYLRGWVTALLVQGWHAPRRRRRAAHRDGIEPPAFAIVSPAAACNLRCRHCYAATRAVPETRLSFAQLHRVLAACDRAGTGLITISGGEPLLWRDDSRDMLDLVAAHRELLFVVYTNATRLDTETAERMRRLGNVIPLLSVEGDAAQTDAVRGEGVYAQVLEGMSALRSAGVLFGVSVTATRDNEAALASGALLRELADERGASFAWVLDLASLGRASEAANALDDAAREALQNALERQTEAHGRLLVSFLHTERSRTGCFGADRFDGLFYLDWAAQVRRCVYVPEPSIDAASMLESDDGCDALLAAAGRLPPCPLAPAAKDAVA